MNSLMFHVDVNDYILKCTYFEKEENGERKEIGINLPDSKLHDIFFSLIKSNPETEPISFEAVNIFNFYNVDAKIINKLMTESKKNQPSKEFTTKKKYNEDKWVSFKPEAKKSDEDKWISFKSEKKAPDFEEYEFKPIKVPPMTPNIPSKSEKESSKNIKVKRDNKFRKTAIRTSASILVALSIFMMSKDAIKNIDFSRDTLPIAYTDEDKETLIDKMNDTGDKIIFYKDGIMDGIESFRDSVGWNDTEEMENFNDKDDNKVEDTIETRDTKEDAAITPIETAEPQTEIMPESISHESSIIPDKYLKIRTDDLVNGEKYNLTNAYYSESITKYSNRYGVPPALAMAIAIQERCLHSNEVDPGGAVGIYQIQVQGSWNWTNRTVRAYNFETDTWDEVLITEESVSDVFVNMQVGCMMLQNLLSSYNYNVAEAVTAYNYGPENVRHVLETCSANTGLSMDELSDINNMDWLEYRDVIKGGDPEYLENVFKYVPNGTILSFTNLNHEVVNVEFDNLTYQNTKDITKY